MHIVENKSTCKSGKTIYSSILLRESFREDGKVKKRTIANLSHCQPEEIAAMKLALKHKDDLTNLGSLKGSVELEQGLSVGAVWTVYQVAKNLGIENALGTDFSGKLALWQVIARVIDQGSRLSAVRLAQTQAACDVLDIRRGFDENDLYDNLKWLEGNQEKIERNLFLARRNNNKPQIFLYDVTSSYLEGEFNYFGEYGYNRDKKKGKKQIVIGLLCDEFGDPVSTEVFPGNTQDPKTFASQVQKAAKVFGCEKVTIVGDRGMIKSAQIKDLPDEFHYITAITKGLRRNNLNIFVNYANMYFMNSTELKTFYDALSARLSERNRRQFAGAAVKAAGNHRVSFVARSLGMSRNTVMAGLKEINSVEAELPTSRIRRKGGGRKRLAVTQVDLLENLERLVEPTLRGDPMSPLRWTCKSTANLSRELKNKGYAVSPRSIAGLLKELKYSLQGNRKSHEGKGHPDRNAQFNYINESVKLFEQDGCPVISVDAKKKELIGDFKNGGKQWRPQGTPELVNVYDFLSLGDGRATPYGAFDLFRNEGWVSVGIDHDTSSFAVDSIFQWWKQMGERAYPKAKKLLITADGGGSNGYRVRLWKQELQRLADETGMEISVRHFPPGTSKWNKIEHRMFSFISMNWRGEPLRSFATVVNLIGATTNRQGLKIECALNTKAYPIGTKVPDREMKTIAIKPENFHGEWNYSIMPNA